MNAVEAARLCRFVSAVAPAQKITEDTPIAWAMLLEEVPYDDAKEAVKDIASRQPFVAPSEIIAAVKAMHAKRLAGVDTDVPPVDPDDVAGYIAALRQAAKRRAEPQREDRPVRREVGRVERQAIEAGPGVVAPASSAHIAALRRSVSRAFPLQVPRVDVVREGQEQPGKQVSPTRPVTPGEAARIDAARVRQAAGLDALTEREEAR